ncbi:hypothetical protein N2152v2_010134 [Parachlorella kessleri]
MAGLDGTVQQFRELTARELTAKANAVLARAAKLLEEADAAAAAAAAALEVLHSVPGQRAPLQVHSCSTVALGSPRVSQLTLELRAMGTDGGVTPPPTPRDKLQLQFH